MAETTWSLISRIVQWLGIGHPKSKVNVAPAGSSSNSFIVKWKPLSAGMDAFIGEVGNHVFLRRKGVVYITGLGGLNITGFFFKDLLADGFVEWGLGETKNGPWKPWNFYPRDFAYSQSKSRKRGTWTSRDGSKNRIRLRIPHA